jgi:peptide/nickel transport system permease protein
MRYLLSRIGFYLVAAWASITLNFFVPRLAPGDPAEALLIRLEQRGPVAPGALEAIRAAFGLNTNEPIWVQYFSYLRNLLTGNLGISVTNYPQAVTTVLGQNIAWTLVLGGVAVIISFFIGCLLGMVMAWRRNSILDTTLSPLMTFLSGIPYFWLALIIVYVFGFTLNLFPFADGYDAASYTMGWNIDFISDAAFHAVLPAITIVLSSISGWMLTMRNSMITTLSEDYIMMARAKGLTERRIIFLYAARNAVLPNITGFAISLGFIVSGQLLTEIVFNYPGIGFSLLKAVEGRDYQLVQGVFLLITLGVLGANFLVDLLYTVLDPRVRRG